MVVRNGQGLPIKNTGSSFLGNFSKNIRLNYMLQVPTIKKNLLSIAKLTTDNNIIVEFDSHFVSVKDHISKMLLLCRTLKAGLYNIALPSLYSFCFSKQHLSCFSSSDLFRHNKVRNSYFSCFNSSLYDTGIWHLRLGHPSFSIMKIIANNGSNGKFSKQRDFSVASPLGKHTNFLHPYHNPKAHTH